MLSGRGPGSAVIFDPCQGKAAGGGPLLDRLRGMAGGAGMPVCGGNGMGFLNLPHRCHATFASTSHLAPGSISMIAHSGSVFTVLALNDPRYSFDLVVSSGQEIGATIDEYIDYAAQRPTTKVIALFMEAARDPHAFVEALRRARARNVPVVVCKVGRTKESAALAFTHSGAMAGSTAAYVAAFEQCGAVVVETVDQLMNATLLLAEGRNLGDGELATVTDSGGLRELLIDRAASLDVPLATLSDTTKSALDRFLPYELAPSNPLDCAGPLNDGFADVFRNGLETLAGAPEVGMLGFEADLRDDSIYMPDLLDLARNLPKMTDKPCFFYSSFARAHNRHLGVALTGGGVPVLNGLDETLLAVDALRQYRRLSALSAAHDPTPKPDDDTVAHWRDVLQSGATPGESEALSLLQDFGILTVETVRCTSLERARAAAERIGYPVALKTAAPGIAHKSDVGGVVLGIEAEAVLARAYEDMAGRLGERVVVQQMAPAGVELAFGCVRDPDFGPLVMVAAGGVLIEHLADRRFALAPFGPARARHLLERLALYPRLAGARAGQMLDVDAVAVALARFSSLCTALSDLIEEFDVNPVMVTDTGAIATDALIGLASEGRS